VLDAENRPWLAFGSFWSGIKLLALDPHSGKPPEPAKLLAIASRPGTTAIEAPFIVRKHGFIYLFVSFDFCGRGVESTYKIMVGRSRDLTGPYRDRSGKLMMDGGGTLLLESHGHVRGPGHNSVLLDGDKDWLVHHYYDARAKGVPTLQIRPLTWGEDGWPRAGEPIDLKHPGPN
jgi:arabinan endo-1,5-alpha-L-arabinosidase